jgi:hypothetical protein
MTIRWISYTSQNIPGNQSFQLGFHSSLFEAKLEYQSYCRGVGTDECTMTLYSTKGDSEGCMIQAARDFADVGCPFDYPDRIIERGPMGGVRINQT